MSDIAQRIINTRREEILWRIADETGAQERRFHLACGATYTEAYLADWATTATTYKMLLAEHRPAVHLDPRIITGKGNP